jgi:ribonuclease HI
MINSFKWNVDGYSLGKPGPFGIGGVLQNHHDHLLGMFSVPVGILDSNIAELRAIVKAIELSASNCLLHHQHLIIESDSAMLLAGCISLTTAPGSITIFSPLLIE